jgi:hypothetical protein
LGALQHAKCIAQHLFPHASRIEHAASHSLAHIVQIENDFNDRPRRWYVAFCFLFSVDDAPPPLATQLV